MALVILILWMTPQAGPVLHVAGVLLVHADHHEDDDGGLSQLLGPVRKFLKHLIVRSTGLVCGLRGQIPVVVGRALNSN